ncbi:flavin reductase family protein [Streptomyces albicerus]|uniref:flavin reductase family protein n=1 Tax=Streptomyces albicerus TaxID=2569859 RepID=UPI00124B5BCE|nr:flavin reductase family protein [Streptomyces albicerus]
MALATRQSPSTARTADDTAVVTAMRHFVTGVTVLTCGVGDEAEGVTVSTFSTVPGEPPMACVALRSGSRGLRAMANSRVFVANGLAAAQEPLARHFARRGRPRGLGQLPPEAWLGGLADNVPRLSGAVAWLECRPELTVPLSDHELVVARVVSAVHSGGTPLVNFAYDLHSGPSTSAPRKGIERDSS